jgi:hypothetical protein
MGDETHASDIIHEHGSPGSEEKATRTVSCSKRNGIEDNVMAIQNTASRFATILFISCFRPKGLSR